MKDELKEVVNDNKIYYKKAAVEMKNEFKELGISKLSIRKFYQCLAVPYLFKNKKIGNIKKASESIDSLKVLSVLYKECDLDRLHDIIGELINIY